MSEFRDVCMAMHEICRHKQQCIGCSLYRFCEHMPVSWSINEIDEAEHILEEYMKTNPSIGQYLEQHGVFSPDSDDQAKLQALYNTKVPMEWLR